MPTFLTEYTDPVEGNLVGPYITATSHEEAEAIAAHIIMEPDGGKVVVLGELGESIPADMDMSALHMIQAQVAREVNQICGKPREKAGPEGEWERVWRDEPKDAP